MYMRVSADVLFRNRGEIQVVVLVSMEMMGIIVSRLFMF
jgi:hypothetical protein